MGWFNRVCSSEDTTSAWWWGLSRSRDLSVPPISLTAN